MLEIVIELDGRVIHQSGVASDLLIGRSTAADICLDARSISRQHCRLSPRAGALFVEDLGSLIGTRVNGDRVSGERRLLAGDVVTLGRVTIRVSDALRAAGTDLLRTTAPGFRKPVAPSGTANARFLDEETSPDDRGASSSSPLGGNSASPLKTPAKLEVSDHAKLTAVLPHVRVGRSFVFIDDAAAIEPRGVMSRLFGHKQKARGRQVKALVGHTPVELPGARLVPAVLEVEKLACLTSDRDLYRVEQDTVRLLVAMPGG